MTKHRKKPEEKKKKKLTKWQLILPGLLVGGGTGIALLINVVIAGPPPLEQCIRSQDAPSVHGKYSFHQHAFLDVTLDGEPFTVPANIGVTGDCVKPLHTNDTSGTIHSEYVKPVRFSLDDLVKLWGLDLNKYDVKVFVKGIDDPDFREVNVSEINTLFLRDQMRIKMQLISR